MRQDHVQDFRCSFFYLFHILTRVYKLICYIIYMLPSVLSYSSRTYTTPRRLMPSSEPELAQALYYPFNTKRCDYNMRASSSRVCLDGATLPDESFTALGRAWIGQAVALQEGQLQAGPQEQLALLFSRPDGSVARPHVQGLHSQCSPQVHVAC